MCSQAKEVYIDNTDQNFLSRTLPPLQSGFFFGWYKVNFSSLNSEDGLPSENMWSKSTPKTICQPASLLWLIFPISPLPHYFYFSFQISAFSLFFFSFSFSFFGQLVVCVYVQESTYIKTFLHAKPLRLKMRA